MVPFTRVPIFYFYFYSQLQIGFDSDSNGHFNTGFWILTGRSVSRVPAEKANIPPFLNSGNMFLGPDNFTTYRVI